MTEINPKVHTSCRNCVFAIYEDKTQTGCKAGRLEKFALQEEVVTEVYDEEKEFFVINNKYCLAYRNEEWGEKYPISEHYKLVRSQMKPPYHLIVIVKKSDTLENLKTTLDSATRQSFHPNVLTIINRNPERVRGYEIMSILKKHKDVFPFWKIENAINLSLHDRDCIDLALDATKSTPFSFYIVFQAGYSIPDNFIEKLDIIINDDLLQFHIIEGDESLNGMIVPKTIHFYYNGNSHGMPLEEKIKIDTCETAKIYQLESVIPMSL